MHNLRYNIESIYIYIRKFKKNYNKKKSSISNTHKSTIIMILTAQE